MQLFYLLVGYITTNLMFILKICNTSLISLKAIKILNTRFSVLKIHSVKVTHCYVMHAFQGIQYLVQKPNNICA